MKPHREYGNKQEEESQVVHTLSIYTGKVKILLSEIDPHKEFKIPGMDSVWHIQTPCMTDQGENSRAGYLISNESRTVQEWYPNEQEVIPVPVDKSVLKGIKIGKHPVQVKEAGEELYVTTKELNAAEKWAEEKMQEMQESMKEIDRDLFKDMLLSNNVMVHISGTGEGRRIVPDTEEWWQNKEKIAKLIQGEIEKKNSPKADTYNTLEEILADVKFTRNRHSAESMDEEIDLLITKLEVSIKVGKYIQNGTK